MQVNRIYFRERKTFPVILGCFAAVLMLSSVRADQGESSDLGSSAHQTAQVHTTPDWAKGVVWYQVFPERFRNGNSGNDPSAWDLSPVPWDRPFDEVTIEEIERSWNRSRAMPERFGSNRRGGAFPGLVYARRYGGDLQGVYEKLETLKNMGFAGIYLCPVFQSRSLHKYDASDHRHIDPTLGHPGEYQDPGPGYTALKESEDPFDETTWEWTEADQWFIDEFLPKAKSLGLKVVIDGVWNHVGLDHFAFNDVRLNGSESAFADWFQVVFDDQGSLIGWQGWSRINGSLPEFRHIGEDLAPGPKAHVMAVTRRWMDPNGDGDPSDGIDGWRLDVAAEIGADFWRDWRGLVKSINPEALIVAEIWHDAGEMLSDEAFDSQMNYPFAYPIVDWLSIGERKGDAALAARRLERVFTHGREVDLTQYNLMTSHDTERLASMMQNSWVRGYDNESSRWFQRYDPEKIGFDARQRAFCAIAAMVVSPGALMVYNGDELALPGADDPDNRRPIPWDQFAVEQTAFRDRVSALLRLRTDPQMGELLRLGDHAFGSYEERTLVIRREYKDSLLVCYICPDGVAVIPESKELGEWTKVGEIGKKFGIDQRKSPVLIRLYERD